MTILWQRHIASHSSERVHACAWNVIIINDMMTFIKSRTFYMDILWNFLALVSSQYNVGQNLHCYFSIVSVWTERLLRIRYHYTLGLVGLPVILLFHCLKKKYAKTRMSLWLVWDWLLLVCGLFNSHLRVNCSILKLCREKIYIKFLNTWGKIFFFFFFTRFLNHPLHTWFQVAKTCTTNRVRN